MTYYGYENLVGGKTHYGYVAGILSLSSSGPRLPGDPGHAQTFNFPVAHAVVEGVTIKDLLTIDDRNLGKIIQVAKQLEGKGVKFVATTCGLFAAFHHEIARELSVPFLSSSLQMVAFMKALAPPGKKIAVFTGHAGMLTEKHLRYSGFERDEVILKGMETYPEFSRIVLEGGSNMDPERFKKDIEDAARSLGYSADKIAMAVLECPNLITFKNVIQEILQVPVHDIVSLINFFADGHAIRAYSSRYV